MSDSDSIDIQEKFKKIRDKLILSSITKRIEYLHYKESIYDPNLIKAEYEEAFYFFPYEEIQAASTIQIFHEFYAMDVWGSIGPIESDKRKYNNSLHEIANRINEPKSDYILKKLRQKYTDMGSDIPGALTGLKRSEKLPEDYPEKNALINLLNKYFNKGVN